jgi:hypothetical protein
MMLVSKVSVEAAAFQTKRSTRLPSRGTFAVTLVSAPVLLSVHRTYTWGVAGKFGCRAMLSRPLSDAEFTARSSTGVAWMAPFVTRFTCPEAFSITKKSPGPRNTMPMGCATPERGPC